MNVMSLSHLAHNLESKDRTKDVILDEIVLFESLLLNKNILKGLTESGFQKPSPIQIKAIPIGKCGFDLIIKSKSGTGKTLVFSVIALETANLNETKIQVVIIVPAREIAFQIQDVLNNIGQFLEGLKVETFIGGLPVESDREKCKTCHIAVGTPGRIKQLIKENVLKTNSVHLFVLDEADKLMETSFQNDINEIYNSLPDKKQIIATSATYPKEMDKFLSSYMLSPTHISVELNTPLLLGLKQFVDIVKCHANVVQQIKIKHEELLNILSKVSFTQCLIFTNYQTRAESISNMLNQKNWNSTFISAAQTQTERLEAVNSLKQFKCRIMVSTDLTARGIDVENVDLVINYDIPIDAVTYLHRMGRAGRYGSSGICINLTSNGAELKLLQSILGVIRGVNLSIPKLPELDGNIDLLKVNISQENCIFGDVSDHVEPINNKIKTEVMKLKEIKTNKKEIENNNAVTKERCTKEGEFNLESLANSKKCQKNLQNSIDSYRDKAMLGISDALTGNNVEAVDINSIESYLSVLKDREKEEIASFLDETKADMKSVPKGSCDNFKEVSLLPDDKKRKRPKDIQQPSSSDLENSQKCKQKANQSDIFYKNQALFSISKALTDKQIQKSDIDSIGLYLNTLKEQEKAQVENSKQSMDMKSLVQNTKHDPKPKELINFNHDDLDVMENIFQIGYRSAINSNSKHWTTYLPESELKHFQDPDAQYETLEDTEEDYIEEEYDDYDMEETAREIEIINKLQPSKSTDEDSSQNYDFMKWIPVDKSSDTLEITPACAQNVDIVDNYDHFNSYFDQCSDHLWQNGLTLGNVDSFDDWFQYEWQAQVCAVRNYVQQNIYVEEMKRFQEQNKSKTKK